ncbi:hypothetical protein ACLB2K_027510 [Fragaria x ananassa]
MSTEECYLCSANQFSGDARFGRRLWIRAMTAPTRFHLLKLIHIFSLFIDPPGVDIVPITFKLYHQTATYSGDTDICYGEWNWVSERRFQVPVSDFRFPPKRDAYTKIITAYLKSLGVPEHEHAQIIEQVREVLDLADRGLPITVWIRRVTLQQAPKAIESYIEGLEKVRVDSLEEANTPCAICTEDLDYFRDVQMIIRLPCLHLYHRDCIASWLERRQVCPLCRYSFPLVQATKTKSSSRSSAWPRWPMLLIMSSGGIMTAMVLCRLLKRA